jgi:hypothetical protein
LHLYGCVGGAPRQAITAQLLVTKGKSPAKIILKARIPLKADQAEGGPGWLDAQIGRPRQLFLTEPNPCGSF